MEMKKKSTLRNRKSDLYLIDVKLFANIYLTRPHYKKRGLKSNKRFFHKYQILPPSMWPFLTSILILELALELLMFFREFKYLMLILTLIQLILIISFWFDDIITESFFHTSKIRTNLRIGMILFIISEIMFFFSFFWAFFHSSLSPSIMIGCSWPPVGLLNLVIDPYSIPLLNTVLLLSSGVTVTYSHIALECATDNLYYKLYESYLFVKLYHLKFYRKKQRRKLFFIKLKNLIKQTSWKLLKKLNVLNKKNENNIDVGKKIFKLRREEEKYFIYLFQKLSFMSNLHFSFCLVRLILYKGSLIPIVYWLCITLGFACLFTGLQIYEYVESKFFISDGIYGSTFYMMTGFHGFHVLIGTIFLFVCCMRLIYGHFDDGYFVGFECAIWYWHFVDAVWLFLYLFVYIWGSKQRTNLFIIKKKYIHGFDFPKPLQILFQDSASQAMETIVNFHHYIMFYLIIILFFVSYCFGLILYDSIRFNNLILNDQFKRLLKFSRKIKKIIFINKKMCLFKNNIEAYFSVTKQTLSHIYLDR